MTRADLRQKSPLLIGTCILLLGLGLFGEPLARKTALTAEWWGFIQSTALAASQLIAAHLIIKLLSNRMSRTRKGARPVPKVALDLLRVGIYAIAVLAGLSMFFHQDLSGFLTGSGLVLAVLGFAIRNVVADMFSGLALGLEAPFRIGDWVHIEGLAQGRVQEIGWRTTRLVTRDSTYVILPNSQISKQRITNYSAPRQEYRDHAELVLPITLPVAETKVLMRAALAEVQSIVQARGHDVQVGAYAPQGVTYRVSYTVPQFDRERACRNEVFSRIDAELRANGVTLTTPAPEGTLIAD